MKSTVDHGFGGSPQANINRSSFDRSFTHKTTFNAGDLIPIFVDEALPGDTFNLDMTAFARMSTPIYPLMDNLHMDFHFFAVPNRLVWENFRKMMGEQVDPADSIDYSIPMRIGTISEGHFEDYLGLPINTGVEWSDLYQRAYRLIWNEWFRDQNLQDSESVPTGDTAGTGGTTLLKRGKRHDYFTSALPWPQKGDAVNLFTGTADVIGIGANTTYTGTTDFKQSDGTTYTTDDVAAPTIYIAEGDTSGYPGIVADLTTATDETVHTLRQAFAINKLLERDARSGTRYAELVHAHFGVDFMDITYRPEYLGGGTLPVNINPVAQTSSTDVTSPQGHLSGFATAGGGGIGFTKSFTEHCILMGFVSVRADLTYQEGIQKMYSRETRYDFFWPELANLSEQAILNKEIYWSNNATVDDAAFGYQERYAEYKYKPSMVTGQMRSNHSTPLDAWHLAQDFASLPVLGDTFIQENPPMDRVLAVNTEPDFIFDSYFNMRCARPMPLYSIPGMMDRF